MFLSNLSIKRPVFATMMMLALIVLGLFSLRRLKLDEMPDVELPFVMVQTRYPGASPEAVEREVAAGRANFVEEDEDGRVVYDRGEHAGEMMAEVEGVLRVVREAFTISLHHFWERELTAKMQVIRYEESKAFAFLKSKGINPNEAGLRTLRLAANVAKHSEGDSANQLHKLRPDLFDIEAMTRRNDPPGYEYLRITDQVLNEFFDAVQASGPQRQPWRLRKRSN